MKWVSRPMERCEVGWEGLWRGVKGSLGLWRGVTVVCRPMERCERGQ